MFDGVNFWLEFLDAAVNNMTKPWYIALFDAALKTNGGLSIALLPVGELKYFEHFRQMSKSDPFCHAAFICQKSDALKVCRFCNLQQLWLDIDLLKYSSVHRTVADLPRHLHTVQDIKLILLGPALWTHKVPSWAFTLYLLSICTKVSQHVNLSSQISAKLTECACALVVKLAEPQNTFILIIWLVRHWEPYWWVLE